MVRVKVKPNSKELLLLRKQIEMARTKNVPRKGTLVPPRAIFAKPLQVQLEPLEKGNSDLEL